MPTSYSYPDNHGIIEPQDDVLNLNPCIGARAAEQCLYEADWLAEFIRQQWSPSGEEGFIDAWSSVARIIAASAVMRSLHPSDISHVTGLPVIFIRIVLLALRESKFYNPFWPNLQLAARERDIASFAALIDELLMESDFGSSIEWLDLLKAVGPELLGKGIHPFSLASIPSPEEKKLWWESISNHQATGYLPGQLSLSYPDQL